MKCTEREMEIRKLADSVLDEIVNTAEKNLPQLKTNMEQTYYIKSLFVRAEIILGMKFGLQD